MTLNSKLAPAVAGVVLLAAGAADAALLTGLGAAAGAFDGGLFRRADRAADAAAPGTA